jgi:hypothetical protein
MVKPSRKRSANAEFPHGMHMTQLRRRIAKQTEAPTRTDSNGANRKLAELVERATANGREQGPLVPVEALITVKRDEWVWQVVDREVLEVLSHRLIFQAETGTRREILMTAGFETAMDAASCIVELDGGCVLIETLDP